MRGAYHFVGACRSFFYTSQSRTISGATATEKSGKCYSFSEGRSGVSSGEWLSFEVLSHFDEWSSIMKTNWRGSDSYRALSSGCLSNQEANTCIWFFTYSSLWCFGSSDISRQSEIKQTTKKARPRKRNKDCKGVRKLRNSQTEQMISQIDFSMSNKPLIITQIYEYPPIKANEYFPDCSYLGDSNHNNIGILFSEVKTIFEYCFIFFKIFLLTVMSVFTKCIENYIKTLFCHSRCSFVHRKWHLKRYLCFSMYRYE